LARQQRHFLRLDPAFRTAHPVELDHHRSAVFRPREIPHLPFVDLSNLLDPPPTPRALQLAVPTLATYPQAQRLGGFVDLAAIDPVPRPSQNLGPFALAHPAERTEKSVIRKPPLIDRLFRFLHRADYLSRPRLFLRTKISGLPSFGLFYATILLVLILPSFLIFIYAWGPDRRSVGIPVQIVRPNTVGRSPTLANACQFFGWTSLDGKCPPVST